MDHCWTTIWTTATGWRTSPCHGHHAKDLSNYSSQFSPAQQEQYFSSSIQRQLGWSSCKLQARFFHSIFIQPCASPIVLPRYIAPLWPQCWFNKQTNIFEFWSYCGDLCHLIQSAKNITFGDKIAVEMTRILPLGRSWIPTETQRRATITE